MRKIQNKIYKLELSDLLKDECGQFILVEDYLDVTITHNNLIFTCPLIIFIKNIEVENTNEEPPPQLKYGYKKMYLSTNINDYIILDNYKIFVNNQITYNRIININNNIDPPTAVNFYSLFFQNIDLYTSQVNYRKQYAKQEYIIKNKDDNTIKEIKISNHIAFPIQIEKKHYLPINNVLLQKICVKMQSNTLRNYPPIAFHLQLLSNNDELLFQLKSNIRNIDYNSQNQNEYYNKEYGHKYGVIYNDNNELIATVWSNEFEYNSNIYIIEWKLSNQQIQTLNSNINNNIIKSITFRARYSSQKDTNQNYIWRGWSENITNIFINIPPPPPSELEMMV